MSDELTFDSNLAHDFQIVWVGTAGNNITIGRSGEKPVALCMHIMEGTMDSTRGWFANSAAQASAHFGVGKDGTIWQFVRVENMAWANGIEENVDMNVDWLAECVRKGINPNNRTISVEHEGFTGKDMPEVQYQASLWLNNYLCTTYGIPRDRDHIIGHYQISAKSRPNCPGTGFHFDRMVSDLQSYNKPTPTNYPFDPNPGKFAVGPGVLSAMAAMKETCATNEQYVFSTQVGERSMTWSSNSAVYVSYKQDDGSWEVHRYVETKLPEE